MKKISLNQDWQFAKGTITMMELMMGDAGNIENIDLPHDAMIYQERTPATANAHQTGFYPGGEYCHRALSCFQLSHTSLSASL